MNDKKAKALRREAKYRNQTATPGTMPFPGVARFYAHPTYLMHTVIKTHYGWATIPEHIDVETGVVTPEHRVFKKISRPVTKVKLNARGKAQELLEYVPEHWDIETFEMTREHMRPKTSMVPVTKPALLNDKEPKGVYRGLKRIEKRWGLANFMATMQGMTARQVAAPFMDAVAKAKLQIAGAEAGKDIGAAPLEPRVVVEGIVNAGTD